MHYTLNSFFDKEEWKSLEVKWSLSTDDIYHDTAVLIALERFFVMGFRVYVSKQLHSTAQNVRIFLLVLDMAIMINKDS